MRKTFVFFTVLLIGAVAWCADLEVRVVAVRNEFLSQWSNTPYAKGPQAMGRTRAAVGERFPVHVLVAHYTIRDGKTDLALKMKITRPDGKVSFEEKEFLPFGGAPLQPNTVALSPRMVLVDFEPEDPLGDYRFEVVVRDRLADRESRAEWTVRNTGKAVSAPGAMTRQELSIFLMNYYRIREPEKLMKAFRGYFALVPELRKRLGKKFFPAGPLAFFARALEDNPQLHDDFFAELDKLSGASRDLALLIASGMDDLNRDGLAKRYPGYKMQPGFSRVEKVEATYQLDMLWSEFFARGTFQPIRRIAEATVVPGRKLSLEEFKKIDGPTDDDRKAVTRTLIEMAAAWSLESNAVRHELVFSYLVAIFRRDAEKNPELKTKIQKILAAAAKRKELAAKRGDKEGK